MSATGNIDNETLQILFAREWARVEMAKIKDLNVAPYFVCSELMAQSIAMTLGVPVELSRTMVTEFFTQAVALAKQSIPAAPGQALDAGPSNVVPLVRPTNSPAPNGAA
jgi:hypothetical protein